MNFIVEGQFVGKQRPRFSNGHVYTPQKTKDYEKLVQQEYIRNYGERKIKEPIFVGIIAYFEPPKSWSKKKKQQAYGGILSPVVKPDIDNIAKTILDALNGLAYEDDKQVVRCEIVKRYGIRPRVAITIKYD